MIRMNRKLLVLLSGNWGAEIKLYCYFYVFTLLFTITVIGNVGDIKGYVGPKAVVSILFYWAILQKSISVQVKLQVK